MAKYSARSGTPSPIAVEEALSDVTMVSSPNGGMKSLLYSILRRSSLAEAAQTSALERVDRIPVRSFGALRT